MCFPWGYTQDIDLCSRKDVTLANLRHRWPSRHGIHNICFKMFQMQTVKSTCSAKDREYTVNDLDLGHIRMRLKVLRCEEPYPGCSSNRTCVCKNLQLWHQNAENFVGCRTWLHVSISYIDVSCAVVSAVGKFELSDSKLGSTSMCQRNESTSEICSAAHKYILENLNTIFHKRRWLNTAKFLST